MIRSYMLSFTLLFSCITPLYSMYTVRAPGTEGGIGLGEVVLRDTLCGGLIVPALLATGIQVLIEHYDGKIRSESETISKRVLGSCIVFMPVVCKRIGLDGDIKPEISNRYECIRNAFRFGYGALALFLLLR